jgi:hypothetical protein
MNRPVVAVVSALLLISLGSCAGTTATVGVTAVSTDPYWGPPVFGYGVGYFGPPVVWGGGWGPGYFVGPPRWGGPRPVVVGSSRGFRPAPVGRPMPSIPSGPRGGGWRGAPVRR